MTRQVASKPAVLIVGAGPTGLTMALECQRHRIPFRIIDKKPMRTETSNALGIQARTLEMLDSMGLANEFVEMGVKITSACLNQNRRKIASLSTHTIESAYPFILVLPQSQTEELLENALEKNGTYVERNTALDDIKQSNHSVEVTLKKTTGEIEILNVPYLIGCDGAHSLTRQRLNIAFTGEDIKEQFLLADVSANMPYPRNQIQAFGGAKGLMAIFPLPDDMIRIIASVPHNSIDDSSELSLHELQALIDERSGNQVQLLKSEWSSQFRIHNRISAQFRQDNVFLLGDACHIHSPAGAQGMNTGMQDAFNLAWKLALVIKKQAKPGLLDTYEKERRPVAESILQTTDKATRLALNPKKWASFLRLIMIRILARSTRLQRKLMARISELDIKYSKSPIIYYGSTVNRKAPSPGELAPDVDFIDQRGNPHRLAELWREPKHHLLIFLGKKSPESILPEVRALARQIRLDYPGGIRIVSISDTSTAEQLKYFVDAACSDNNFYIHQKYRTTNPAIYLLRPDNYISFCASDLAIEPLFRAIGKTLTMLPSSA